MCSSDLWVEGVGEQVTPITLPEAVFDTPLWLIKPQTSIPTPAIFGSPLLRRDTPAVTLGDFMAAPLSFGHNDLQPPAEAHAPEVSAALAALQHALGNARMSGSGSAVFGWETGREPSGDTASPPRRVDDLRQNAQKNGWLLKATCVLRHHPVLD